MKPDINSVEVHPQLTESEVITGERGWCAGGCWFNREGRRATSEECGVTPKAQRFFHWVMVMPLEWSIREIRSKGILLIMGNDEMLTPFLQKKILPMKLVSMHALRQRVKSHSTAAKVQETMARTATMHFELLGFYKSVRVLPPLFKLQTKYPLQVNINM